MKSSELFQRLSPALVTQMFRYLQEHEKPSFKMSIQTLAAQRKLRPVFVERKPREERFTWLHGALSRPAAESIAANLIQMWLMGEHAALLCDFLDALSIAHDEKGGIESLPESPSAEQLRFAVDAVLAKHPAETVAVYLQSFQSMDIAGWPALGEILASDERLRLGVTAPGSGAAHEPARD